MTAKTLAKKVLLSNPLTAPPLRRWLSRPRDLSLDGIRFTVADRSRTISFAALIREFRRDVYGLRSIPFEPGDAVIDIGAHVGIESIYLAKRYPFQKIYAYEPVRENYLSLKQKVRIVRDEH